MLIDWFTVAAQMVNFLVLIWLLKRFAYKPILSAIDAREKRIVAQQSEATANNAAAGKLRSDLQAKTDAFDRDLGALKAKGTDDINHAREQQLQLARQEADRLRATEHAELLTERKNLGDQVTHMATDAVFESVRKALLDLGGVSVDERILAVFAERLRNLDDDAKATFKAALVGASTAAVSSRFAIGADARAILQTRIDETFGVHVALEFATETKTIGGVELRAGGQSLAWSVADYLQSLSRQLDTLLSAPAGQTGGVPAIAP
jgi:F-type H+-transporting ATPase subunit b